jgi:hypothetical protein
MEIATTAVPPLSHERFPPDWDCNRSVMLLGWFDCAHGVSSPKEMLESPATEIDGQTSIFVRPSKTKSDPAQRMQMISVSGIDCCVTKYLMEQRRLALPQ